MASAFDLGEVTPGCYESFSGLRRLDHCLRYEQRKRQVELAVNLADKLQSFVGGDQKGFEVEIDEEVITFSFFTIHANFSFRIFCSFNILKKI